jgi:PadR family transcriptional regulator PadR
LESQGLLVSQWREENNRTKRFYHLSAEGTRVLKQLLEEWRRLNSAVDKIAVQTLRQSNRKPHSKSEQTKSP